jgi:hypothetical protein
MKPTVAICCIGAVALLVITAHAQKPIREGVTSVLYKEPPSTLSGLYSTSDSVVVVRVTKTRGIDSLQPGLAVMTEITGTITEVVKPSAQVGPVGSSVTFHIYGGEVDRGEYIERIIDKRQPQLVKGHDYLIAMTWNRSENAFFSAFGPGSIFEVAGETITPQWQTTLATRAKNLNKDGFIAEMKKPIPRPQ